MRTQSSTPRFDREYQVALATGEFSPDDFERLVYILCKYETLPPDEMERYYEHPLEDEYGGYLECHLSGDIIVIYKKFPAEVRFARFGRHTQLFGHRKFRRKGVKKPAAQTLEGDAENALTKAARSLKKWWSR